MPGCLATLSRVLSSNLAVGVKELAARLLGHLAISSPAAVAAEPGCISGLLKLLSSNNLWAQYEAVFALRVLAWCSADRCRAIMAEPGCLTSLLQLLSSDSVMVPAAAASALWRLVATALPADTSAAIRREPACLKPLEQLLNHPAEQKAAAGYWVAGLQKSLSLVLSLTALQPSSESPAA